MSNRKAGSYEQAKYQYISQCSDSGRNYKQPSEELSAEFPKWWVLRDHLGFIAAVDKQSGRLL
tara:strand:- start:1600 stop:1788 length:189 start_codon:yes stop_codon:yes gene_type:complete